MSNDFLFTSESVSEGHPDKVADQISDAILDAIFAQDPRSRVAAETLTNTGLVVLAGEITTNAHVDYIQVARDTIKRIGYDNTEYGIDYKGCAVMVCYDKQSNDIAQGVDHASDDHLNIGAGDQGLMFGYACDETPELMPAPIYFAHRLVERQAQLRKDGRLPFLRPDAKSQVTLRYVDGKPHSIDTVVLSSQHAPEYSLGHKMTDAFYEAVREIDGCRHQLGRLVAGVAEHQALVTGAGVEVVVAGVVNTLGDVVALLVIADHHRAALVVDAVVGVVVADALDRVARDLDVVDVGLGGDLTRQHHQTGVAQRFSGDAAARVLLENRVEDGV